MGHPPVNDSNNNPLRSSVCLPSPGRALDGRRRALETARWWSRSNQQWASNCRLSLEASADSRLDDTASTHGDTDFGQETVIPSPFHQKSTNPRKARNRCERGGRGLLWRLGRINRAAPAFLTCPKQEVLEHEMALADRSGDRGTTTLCLGWDWREHCHDTNWAFYGGFASASDFPDFCHQRPATQSRGEMPDCRTRALACLPGSPSRRIQVLRQDLYVSDFHQRAVANLSKYRQARWERRTGIAAVYLFADNGGGGWS